jgi:hypothetical protein
MPQTPSPAVTFSPGDLAGRRAPAPAYTITNPTAQRAVSEILAGLRFLETLPTRDLAIARLRRTYEAHRRAGAATTTADWRLLSRQVEDVVAYGPDRTYTPPARKPAPRPATDGGARMSQVA